MPKNYQYFEIGGTDTYFMNVDGRTPIFPNKLLNWASIIINQQRKKIFKRFSKQKGSLTTI